MERSTGEVSPLLSIGDLAPPECIVSCSPPEIEDGDNDNCSANGVSASLSHHQKQQQQQQRGRLISALSNFSTQYNLGSIAPALLLLDPKDGVCTLYCELWGFLICCNLRALIIDSSLFLLFLFYTFQHIIHLVDQLIRVPKEPILFSKELFLSEQYWDSS